MRRAVIAALSALAVLLVVASTAVAGGWAVTTFDALPTQIRAGETYDIGYTILQHGRMPLADWESHIRITSASGASEDFKGLPAGQPGHYLARVRFPASGTWRWGVDQGQPFGFQPLADVTVLPPAPEAAPTMAPRAPAVGPAAVPIALPALAELPGVAHVLLRIVAPLALAVGLALLAMRLAALSLRATRQ